MLDYRGFNRRSDDLRTSALDHERVRTEVICMTVGVDDRNDLASQFLPHGTQDFSRRGVVQPRIDEGDVPFIEAQNPNIGATANETNAICDLDEHPAPP